MKKSENVSKYIFVGVIVLALLFLFFKSFSGFAVTSPNSAAITLTINLSNAIDNELAQVTFGGIKYTIALASASATDAQFLVADSNGGKDSQRIKINSSRTVDGIIITVITSTQTGNIKSVSIRISDSTNTAVPSNIRSFKINNVRLENQSGQSVYVLEETEKVYLFAIIPVSVNVKQNMDSSGKIISTNNPWWSFLAS